MAALPRSWSHLWSLLKPHAADKPHAPQPFVPMAVLRDTKQAFKADAACATATPAAESSSAAVNHAPDLVTTPPAPAANSAMACAAKRPPKLFVLPNSRSAAMPDIEEASAAMPHTAIAPPFVLSGRIADVCAQLEQWAAQEERWLRTG